MEEQCSQEDIDFMNYFIDVLMSHDNLVYGQRWHVENGDIMFSPSGVLTDYVLWYRCVKNDVIICNDVKTIDSMFDYDDIREEALNQSRHQVFIDVDHIKNKEFQSIIMMNNLK